MAYPQESIHLGIMISQRQADEGECADSPPLQMPEDLFCRQLCKFGRKLGINAYLFDASCPQHASAISGYTLNHGVWERVSMPLPDIVYDRTMCRTARQIELRSRTLAALKQKKSFILMNGSLPDKWNVHTLLQQDEEMQPWLVPSARYEGSGQLIMLEKQHPYGLFLKPSAGTHGKGALHVFRSGGKYRIEGRDRHNGIIACEFNHLWEAADWIQRFASGTYLVQPYLRLSGDNDRPFDVRALIQKNNRGHWSFTGAALREGERGSVTSNLHGGGKAVGASESLTRRFGGDTAARLLADIRRISQRAAVRLEESCGRLAEIGFDFGIE
ncbi:YheC/YheD family protein, partial [Paenibacillus sepulcri]|nr:YheC/YheD family protein [Paenibacillus sepulcri]